MNPRILRDYRILRNVWNEPASRALQLARDIARAEDLNIEFVWESEQERAEDVFGSPSRYTCHNCKTVTYSKSRGQCCSEPFVTFHDTGVYFDPTSEHYSLMARYIDPESHQSHWLASLGMISDAWDKAGYRGYHWLCEAEMAAEAIATLDRLIETRDETATEDTLA